MGRSEPKRTTSLTRIARLRLVAQGLVGSTRTTPKDVVTHMLAMQAQDFAGAKLSIGLRAPHVTDADVEAALAKGILVRSWPMRGTLHVTAAEDLPWMLDLLAPRVLARTVARRAALHLDAKTLDRAATLALGRLAGRNALTRDELIAAFEEEGISCEGQRGYHILGHLCLIGALCQGPRRGTSHTFVRLDEWIGRRRARDREDALAELARRYFDGHGPAALADFQGWAGLTAGDAKAALALARPHLAEAALGDVPQYMARDLEDRAASLERSPAREVLMLPGFDELVLGYKQRSAVLHAAHAPRIVPGGNGMFLATVVIGGRVVGTWRKARRAKETVLTVTPFVALPAGVERALARRARRYGAFWGVDEPVKVTLGTRDG